ncbi:MAG: TonB-dependent receptor plug [Verrucomicrobiales bacterium]|nr:TonB-dependent receptor plug [Verrucomicrobiales bacterium]
MSPLADPNRSPTGGDGTQAFPQRSVSADKSYKKVAHALSVALAFSALLTGNLVADEPLQQPGIPAEVGSNSNKTDALVAKYKGMSLEELMNQEVTSVARRPEPLRNAAAAIDVITQDEIRRSGATSLPEALRLADNLYVAQLNSSGWAISARGFNSSVGNKLLVLMDGRTIYSPLFSGVIWNMQDYLLEDIDRIEVISGPGGALWGANAVNGVINIVSRSARDTQGLYAEAGGGTWLHDFVGLRYGGTISSNVYYRVYGKYFDRGAEDFANGKSAQDSWNRGQGGFRIDSYAMEGNVMTLEGGGFGGENDVVPGGQGSPRFTGNSAGAHALGRWTHTFAEETEMSLKAYYDRTHLQAPFQSSGTIPAGSLNDDLDTFDLDFQHRFPIGERNLLVWGGEYRFTHDVIKQSPLLAFLPGTLDQNLFSAFLQDEIKLHEKLSLTLGTKIEHNDYTGLEYEPNVRLQWKPTEKQMVWGAVSRAVRTPSRYDRDLFDPNPIYGSLLVGNSTFKSETVIAYELGYRAQLVAKVSASLSAFYNDYSDLRSLNLGSGGALPFTFQNNLEAQTYGFELSSDYQVLERWRLHAGYDLLLEHIHVGPGGDFANGLGETADPKHQIFLRSSIDLPGRWEFDSLFRWVATVHNNNASTPGIIPSYPELNLRLGWHATKNIEVSVVGQNLLHDRHPESGFAGPTQEQIVRSVYAKLAFRW